MWHDWFAVWAKEVHNVLAAVCSTVPSLPFSLSSCLPLPIPFSSSLLLRGTGSGWWLLFVCHTVCPTIGLGSLSGSWDQFLIQTSSATSHVKSQLRRHQSNSCINAVIPRSCRLSEQMGFHSPGCSFALQVFLSSGKTLVTV